MAEGTAWRSSLARSRKSSVSLDTRAVASVGSGSRRAAFMRPNSVITNSKACSLGMFLCTAERQQRGQPKDLGGYIWNSQWESLQSKQCTQEFYFISTTLQSVNHCLTQLGHSNSECSERTHLGDHTCG